MKQMKKEKQGWISRWKQRIKKNHPMLTTYYQFYQKMGYFCHLKHPRTLNEKIQYLKFFYYPNNSLVAQCADKYAVRNYIREKGLEDLLVPLIGYWENAEDVDFDSLPDSFVLKCNHGSGYNILCPDKCKFDKVKQRRVLREWMADDFSSRCFELQYKNIPRKIIAEKYLGEEIYDYKFFCLNGEPEFLYISQEIPNTNGLIKCCFWDAEGNLAQFKRTDEYFFEEGNYPKLPQNFEEMKRISAILAREFPFVRVDLFEVNGKVYFSELTFTPAAEMMPLSPKEWDRKLGNLLRLDRS